MNNYGKEVLRQMDELFLQIDKCNNEIKEAAESEQKKHDKFVDRISNYKERIKHLKGGK